MKKETEQSLRPTIIKVDKSLDKYSEMGLFQKKVDEANAIVKKYGLPKFDKE